jgi:hypothetical protein
MRETTWLYRVAVRGPALALVAMMGANACGSDVASCATVCTFSDAPGGCATTCAANQTASAAIGAGADFQAYLTCLNNAGSFAAAEEVCNASAETVATETHTAILQPGDGVGGGGSGVDGGGGEVANMGGASCASATCASVCAADNELSCAQGCESAQASCTGESAEFQSLLTCLCESGGVPEGATTDTQCAQQILALGQNCDAFETGH